MGRWPWCADKVDKYVWAIVCVPCDSVTVQELLSLCINHNLTLINLLLLNSSKELAMLNYICLHLCEKSRELDIEEANAGCANNKWNKSLFGTTNEPGCVR